MQTIINALKAIYNFFADFFSNIIKFFDDIFLSLWDMVKDFFYWVFETVMNLAVSAIQSLDVSSINQHVGAFGSLPSEILNVCGLLGMGTCLAIIASAIGIRLIMQLIPFTRLGS